MKDITAFFDFLAGGVSPCHVVMEVETALESHGFRRLSMEECWRLTQGGRYYVNHHDTTLAAFVIGGHYKKEDGIRIGAAHTDFPCLKIKPNPEICSGGYGQLNVECYGGGIWNTWLDRPLSVAGRVAQKSGSVFAPVVEKIDISRPILTIPNLAIHMNREVNKGIELNKQKDLLPVLMILPEEEKDGEWFLRFLAEELGAEKESILDYELTVYNAEQPCYTGAADEFISSPRLDNLTSVYAVLEGIAGADRDSGINLAVFFDHEEVGSRTKQGAASLLLRDILRRILLSLGEDEPEAQAAVYRSRMLSVDVAHALHPNYPAKADPTSQPVLNRGICLKETSSQSYATDCAAVAAVQQLCGREQIMYQKFVNRSDMPGGSTLGAIASAMLPVPTVDLGVPILAMHSARELMGRKDMEALCRCMAAWYGTE